MAKPIGRNDRCWCGSGRKYKLCHAEFDSQLAIYSANGYEIPNRKLVKNTSQIEGIKQSSQINIALLNEIEQYVMEGVCTAELDRRVHDRTLEMGGIPATLGYNGFPKSTCISVNNVVCHGIPSTDTFLHEGDIVNIDVSTIYNGFFSDSSRMFTVGHVSEEKARLVRIAKECMDLGIQAIKPWGQLGDVGQAVNEHANKNGYTVVREIGGHGIGLQFHEDPWVSYVSKAGTGMLLVPGLVFTVEPMINMGKAAIITDKKDNWTVYTKDGMPSAQWEKTVLITEAGADVLTY